MYVSSQVGLFLGEKGSNKSKRLMATRSQALASCDAKGNTYCPYKLSSTCHETQGSAVARPLYDHAAPSVRGNVSFARLFPHFLRSNIARSEDLLDPARQLENEINSFRASTASSDRRELDSMMDHCLDEFKAVVKAGALRYCKEG